MKAKAAGAPRLPCAGSSPETSCGWAAKLDGDFTWGEELHEGGGGACFFRIRSDGVKNGHWPRFDQTVFLVSDE